jgi:hypothetical protein
MSERSRATKVTNGGIQLVIMNDFDNRRPNSDARAGPPPTAHDDRSDAQAGRLDEGCATLREERRMREAAPAAALTSSAKGRLMTPPPVIAAVGNTSLNRRLMPTYLAQVLLVPPPSGRGRGA